MPPPAGPSRRPLRIPVTYRANKRRPTAIDESDSPHDVSSGVAVNTLSFTGTPPGAVPAWSDASIPRPLAIATERTPAIDAARPLLDRGAVVPGGDATLLVGAHRRATAAGSEHGRERPVDTPEVW